MKWLKKIKLLLGFDKITFEDGLRKLQSRDYQGAIASFDQVLQLQVRYEAFQNRGAANFKLENYQEAIRDFTQAVALNPYLTEAHLALGIVHTHLQDFGLAINNYDEVLKIAPGHSMAYTNRGYAKYKLNDLEGALSDFNAALKLYENNPIAYANRGSIQFKLGNMNEAETDWNKAKLLGFEEAEKMLNHHFSLTAVRN
jgi:tetratricopeptide (TPR) repeat protein